MKGGAGGKGEQDGVKEGGGGMVELGKVGGGRATGVLFHAGA